MFGTYYTEGLNIDNLTACAADMLLALTDKFMATEKVIERMRKSIDKQNTAHLGWFWEEKQLRNAVSELKSRDLIEIKNEKARVKTATI